MAIGLLGGFASAAYIDLLIRSCPKGLEGTGIMLGISGSVASMRGGDLFGTWLYLHGGFGVAIGATVAAYALIAPVLLFVPRHVTCFREGERADEHGRLRALDGALPDPAGAGLPRLNDVVDAPAAA